MRRCSTNMASGQCKLKQDTTIYLLECPKSETLTPPNVRIWSNRNSHALLVQIQNGTAAAAAAKSLQSCPTLCDPVDGSPPGSPVPGILQAWTLEWVASSFSNAGRWKVKVKLLSCVRLLATWWTAAYQIPVSMGFSRQEYWSGLPSPSPQNGTATMKDNLAVV